MDNFELFDNKLAPDIQNPFSDNRKIFLQIMSKIISESQIQTASNAHSSSSKMIKEGLNDFLAPQSLEFWKKNASSKIELALVKVPKKYLLPPPTSTDVKRLPSTAGDILSNEINRLLPKNLEKPLFCRENQLLNSDVNNFLSCFVIEEKREKNLLLIFSSGFNLGI